MPGIHPKIVRKKIMRTVPQPLSTTDKGGKTMAKTARQKLILKNYLCKGIENYLAIINRLRVRDFFRNFTSVIQILCFYI